LTRSRREGSAKSVEKEESRLWLWAGYTEGEGYAVGFNHSGLPEKVEDQLALGQQISEMPKRYTIREITALPLPDVLRTPTMYPAVSDRVREVLEKRSRANIQFVPVKLEGYRNESYWLAHVVDELALVDRERSKVRWNPNDPRYIKFVGPMVLNDPPPGSPLYFRLAELPVLVVDNELKEALQQATPSAGHFFTPWKFGE
jgi:hypothetical protein